MKFREIEHFAFELGERVMNGSIGSSEAAALISKRYTLFGPERIDRIVSQACYFAMK